ncbi:hypothetical protein [Pararhizobium sp.]|uniref:hypothetical protein n=1 Tax=Pararhizobium sp. TaxID=1977563 RepID=UPI0027193582|nr:hypothetical protein [Pararhizobium sp.]MDO9416294.1 hypothetical protein [Pararhizobium sp.]
MELDYNVRDRNEGFEPGPVLTKDDVSRRVDDWLKRLRDLFAVTTEWALKNGWTVGDVGSTPMNEELMQHFGIAARDQPVLRLDKAAESYALFKPKALWVIGANGRIDLYTSKGVFIIIDQADKYEQPRWTLFRGSNKKEGDRFSPELILSLV